MTPEISNMSLAPIATVVAAFITAFISFVNMTLSKEQKTSEFRQAWIDGLRGDLAIFFSSARALCRTMEENRNIENSSEDIRNFIFTKEKIGEMRLNAVDSLYRIKLRLNNKEGEHIKLNQLLESAIAIQNQINVENGKDYFEALAAIELAASKSQEVLKKEWERVKLGEKSFQTVKRSANLVAVILFVILVSYVLAQVTYIIC